MSRQFRSRGCISSSGGGGQTGSPSKLLKHNIIIYICVHEIWMRNLLEQKTNVSTETYHETGGSAPGKYPCHSVGHSSSSTETIDGCSKFYWKKKHNETLLPTKAILIIQTKTDNTRQSRKIRRLLTGAQ